MRTKFTIIGIIGVVVIGLLYLIYLTLPRDEKSKGDEVKLRSDIKSGYTVDEMIKEVKKNTRRNQYEETKPDTSNEEDLQRIQELIKQNEGAFQEPPVPQRAVTVDKPEIKDKELLQIDTTSIAKTKPAQPARRTFNSIRLIKKMRQMQLKHLSIPHRPSWLVQH